MKTKMLKSFSLILTLVMLLSAIPFTASAATITLDKTNVELIPPTPSKSEINFGDPLSTVELIGGKLFYKNPDTGEKIDVAGHYEWVNTATKPTTTGSYTGSLKFFPEDTETYGESVRVSHITMKNCLAEGASWHSIYIRGTATTITTPPAFACDAGDNLNSSLNYTKTGGKVVDADGNDVTSSGLFSIDDALTGGKNQYLYEDTYVTAKWSGKQKGYEDSFYENVLVKVTKKKARLDTAPSIPQVLAGTLFKDVMAKLTAEVYLDGNIRDSYDVSATYWVPTYPEGYDENTPVNEDITFTVTYKSPATDDTFSAEVSVDTYTKPLATITEKPTVDATALKPGMKYSAITLTGGKAVKEGTTEEVSGKFSIVNPDTILTSGWNYDIEIIFVPDDTEAYDASREKINVRVESLVTTKPTLDSTNAKAGAKVSTLTLSGGEATEEGTFAFENPEQVLAVGSNKIVVKFIPAAVGAEYFETINFFVKIKDTVRFVDSEGKEIVPEIELGYNTKDLQYNLDEIKNLLKPYANCGEENFYCNWQDLENKDLPCRKDSLEVNTTKEYIIRGLSYDSDNYAPAMLTFKLKVVPRKLTATVRYTGTAISVDTTKPLTDKLYGTFEYYANGEKIGTSQITTTTDATGLPWKPEKSGVYDITVKFVPDEKDVYYFDDTTVEDMEIICAWGVTVENGTVKVSNSYKENGSFKYGADVSVQSKTNASFSHWIVTDTKGNEIEIEGFDKNKAGNTFKMPDFSVNFKAIDLTQRKITCVNCFVKNAVGTADAPIRYKGQKVSIGIDEAALPLEKFAGWEITDSNGNAYMPDGLTEEALASTNIEFTMPDFDITVKAKNVDDEKGDGFFAQVKAFFENLFNGETECPVLKWIIKVFNAIVNFFTGLFVK